MNTKNTTIKAILIARVIELISSKYNMTLDEARNMFYKSDTLKLVEDDETGLYGDSPLYIFSIYKKEYNKKAI